MFWGSLFVRKLLLNNDNKNVNWIRKALFKVLHIKSIINFRHIDTLVVVNYMCTHNCPGIAWQKRGCQSAPNKHFVVTRANISSHLFDAKWEKCLAEPARFQSPNLSVTGQLVLSPEQQSPWMHHACNSLVGFAFLNLKTVEQQYNNNGGPHYVWSEPNIAQQQREGAPCQCTM